MIARKIAGRQTASVYLKELARIGVLEEKAVGREKLFIHPKLMRLLTSANKLQECTPPNASLVRTSEPWL